MRFEAVCDDGSADGSNVGSEDGTKGRNRASQCETEQSWSCRMVVESNDLANLANVAKE